ncbi:hypothetical protein [Croceicoccus gelatinilyticus]|uniref:hypothetical protein n=1 Tax=Croceicoccus gelatinilyticus TaxID=2835536 RepID=UPI001CEDFFE1|nr:hypothetical protein [Croceicoccus gelatinilyticus]
MIEQRREAFLEDFARHMDGVAGGSPREVVGAYIGFPFERFHEDEWHDYVRVLAKSANAYDLPAVRSNLMKFDPMPRRVQQMLHDVSGIDDQAFLRRIVLYAESTVTTLFISDFLIDRRVGPAMDAYAEKVVAELTSIMSSALTSERPA